MLNTAESVTFPQPQFSHSPSGSCRDAATFFFENGAAMVFRICCKKLRLYLTYLPQTLPLPSANNSIYGFENFVLDQDWVEDAGEKAAVNRELEVRLGSRAKGPIHLK